MALFNRSRPAQATLSDHGCDGSPAVALGIEHPFTAYLFIEQDHVRVEALQQLASEWGNTRQVRIYEEDCNQSLRDNLISNPRVNWSRWRAVVFLDPFGMQVPWETIAELGSTGAVEVFINFPVGMAIQRLLRRNASFTTKQRDKLNSYFGDPGWYEVVYRSTPGLFGNDEVRKADDAAERLVAWYRGRLEAAFGYASDPYLVRNTRGGHLYYLLFAGPNKTGARIAGDVLRGGTRIPSR